MGLTDLFRRNSKQLDAPQKPSLSIATQPVDKGKQKESPMVSPPPPPPMDLNKLTRTLTALASNSLGL